MVGYTIPTPTLMQGIPALKVQPVVAYSVLDPDVSGVDPCKVTTLGVNLYPDDNLKVMLNYRMIDDPDGAYFDSEDDVFEIRTQLLFK